MHRYRQYSTVDGFRASGRCFRVVKPAASEALTAAPQALPGEGQLPCIDCSIGSVGVVIGDLVMVY